MKAKSGLLHDLKESYFEHWESETLKYELQRDDKRLRPVRIGFLQMQKITIHECDHIPQEKDVAEKWILKELDSLEVNKGQKEGARIINNRKLSEITARRDRIKDLLYSNPKLDTTRYPHLRNVVSMSDEGKIIAILKPELNKEPSVKTIQRDLKALNLDRR